jgi:hypothetical protein
MPCTFPTLPINCSRSTIRVKLDGEDDILGVGDAINKTESEQVAALSALHQLNALGKVCHSSYVMHRALPRSTNS